MEGKRKLFQNQEYIPSILFREENNVKHYITLKSNNSNKLTTTTVSDRYCYHVHCSITNYFYFRTEILQQLFWSNL